MVHRPGIKSYFYFFIIAVIAITAECSIPFAEADALGGRHLIVRFLLPTIEAITVLLPYWLLPRRKRWTTLIPIWLLAIWFTCCIWYYRFWNDFPDITAIFLVDNMNSELFNSVVGLWKPRDLWIPLFPILATIYYFYARNGIESYTLSWKPRIAAITATLVCFLAGQAGYSIIMRRYFDAEQIDFNMRQATYMRLVNTNAVQSHSIRINGFVAHYIASAMYAYELLTINRELSDEEVDKINSFITGSNFNHALPDSLRQANSAKNVILIVVESLNSSVIDAECNGKPIAPTLKALNSSDMVVSALDVETQIRNGGSGDGQLMANTGIHPLPRFSTSILVGSKNIFPSLPRMLKRKSNLVIFADPNLSWNENGTFNNFGFDRVLCNLDYTEELHKLGSDAAMFQVADSLLPTLPEPFFLELLTTSMHIPFDDPEIPQNMQPEWIAQPDGTVGLNEKYFRMVNYFDSALAGFITNLKDRNLYDDTLIFIVSDHSQDVLTDPDHPVERMTFMAINSGIGEKINRRVSQIDVYPTILQLAGVGDSVIWKGAGSSMLGEEQTDERKELAKEISELILRGDYFRGKICTE